MTGTCDLLHQNYTHVVKKKIGQFWNLSRSFEMMPRTSHFPTTYDLKVKYGKKVHFAKFCNIFILIIIPVIN
jgi:hypothetical protein